MIGDHSYVMPIVECSGVEPRRPLSGACFRRLEIPLEHRQREEVLLYLNRADEHVGEN